MVEKKFDTQSEWDFSHDSDDNEGVVYTNGKILTPETVRAINRRPVKLDPKVDKYVITTRDGIRPFREGLDKVAKPTKKRIF